MLFIYSSGGFAREFYRNARVQYPEEKVYFIDDNPTGNHITYATACALKKDAPSQILVGFADPDLRKKKTEQVLKDGFELASVHSSTCIIGDNIEIGVNSVLSDYSILTADIQIGHSFHCNIYSYVAHDCRIGNYVTLAPRVSINGRVEIEDRVYIGTGATILPGKDGKPITIGEGAVIGAHALVTKNVPAGTTVVGAPAKPLEKRT